MNRNFKFIIANACLFLLCGVRHLFLAQHTGPFIIAMVCLIISATLFIVSPSFREPPPTLTDLRSMMRGFYERMLS